MLGNPVKYIDPDGRSPLGIDLPDLPGLKDIPIVGDVVEAFDDAKAAGGRLFGKIPGPGFNEVLIVATADALVKVAGPEGGKSLVRELMRLDGADFCRKPPEPDSGKPKPMEARGRGERNQAAKPSGTANPNKHVRPHATKPNKVEVRDNQTGKWVEKDRSAYPDVRPMPPPPAPTPPTPPPPPVKPAAGTGGNGDSGARME